MNATETRERPLIHIRWLIQSDMKRVAAIEAGSFEHPWDEEDFLRCLRQRNCIGMVAERGDRVVGYMLYELHRSRLHILNFAVAHSHRRRGVGTQMVSKLISKLSGRRRTRIALEVREANLAAQLFFKAQGFKAVKILRDWYEDAGGHVEDGYRMEYRLPGGTEED